MSSSTSSSSEKENYSQSNEFKPLNEETNITVQNEVELKSDNDKIGYEQQEEKEEEEQKQQQQHEDEEEGDEEREDGDEGEESGYDYTNILTNSEKKTHGLLKRGIKYEFPDHSLQQKESLKKSLKAVELVIKEDKKKS